MLFGAIDVGTNSIHLIVVELDPRFGTSRTILKAREMVRLGGGRVCVYAFSDTNVVIDLDGKVSYAEWMKAADLRFDLLDTAKTGRLTHDLLKTRMAQTSKRKR